MYVSMTIKMKKRTIIFLSVFTAYFLFMFLNGYSATINESSNISYYKSLNLTDSAKVSDAFIFSGAQGFGVESPAGRGGQIIKVTNLNANGTGSLAAAIETSGPRIIVFEVGGVIDLGKANLKITQPYITIAGQTAPSPGITLIKGGLEIRTHDVLIQHIRVRMGDAGAPKKSGFEPEVTTKGANSYNIVVDHCSFCWAVDENISVSGPRFNGYNGTSRKVTYSNNIISEGLYNSIHTKGIHSMGTLVHDYCTDVAIIRNLYAHNNERNPWFKGFCTGVIVNNVIYNPGKWAMRLGFVPHEWDSSGISPQIPAVSIVGNYMKYGPNTLSGLSMIGSNSGGNAYLEDNQCIDKSGNPAPIYSGITVLSAKPSWPANGITVLASSTIVNQVINHSGARPRDRDSTDKRIISEFTNGNGGFINSQDDVGGYPTAQMTRRTLTVPSTGIDEWLQSFSSALE
jgi:hypothetical protein